MYICNFDDEYQQQEDSLSKLHVYLYIHVQFICEMILVVIALQYLELNFCNFSIFIVQ